MASNKSFCKYPNILDIAWDILSRTKLKLRSNSRRVTGFLPQELVGRNVILQALDDKTVMFSVNLNLAGKS